MAGNGGLPDGALQLGKYWGDPTYSDMTLRIVETELKDRFRALICWPQKTARLEGPVTAPGRADSELAVGYPFRPADERCVVCKHTLNVSRIVLAAGSGYFSTSFGSGFTEFHSPTAYSLEVGPGEADTAKAVLRSIYTGKVPEQASVSDLILMFKMADRLQTTTAGLFVQALTASNLSDWDWGDIILVASQPPFMLEPSSSFAPVVKQAWSKLLSVLGDLEVVMQPANTDAQQKLARLPTTAMEALLGSEQLKVASENTAVAAATFWLQHERIRRELGGTDADAEMADLQQQLAQKLRLCWCSPSYLRSCFTEGSQDMSGAESTGFSSAKYWLREQLNEKQREWLLCGAVQTARTGRGPNGVTIERLQDAVDTQAGAAAWWGVARPMSSMPCGKLELQVSIVELASRRPAFSTPCWYGGYTWKLQVEWASYGPIWAFIEVDKGTLKCKWLVDKNRVSYNACVRAAPSHPLDPVVHRLTGGPAYGCCGFFGKELSSVADANEKLANYIHTDGKLHFTAEVSSIW